MTSTDPRRPNPGPLTPTSAAPASAVTLGEHVAGQLGRLRAAAGTTDGDGARDPAVRDLLDLLGPAARRPLSAGPPSPSFVCDDHSPVEFSLALAPGRPATVRVLAEPGCTADTLAENGRAGMRALEELAARHHFSTGQVRRVADLFLPAAVRSRFALWCAMDLRRDGPPGVKVYVNPRAHGPGRTARVTQEALTRCGFGRAWSALRDRVLARGPGRDEILFLALDLGPWASPRVKVYTAHYGTTAAEADTVSRLLPGARAGQVAAFCRALAGGVERFDRRPLVSCFAYTGRDAERPSGCTTHVPVRDYARDDCVALDRATRVLRDLGMDASVVGRAAAAMTPRALSDGVGLLTYVSLVRSTGQPPRANVYFSPEAYAVRPPSGAVPQPSVTARTARKEG